MDFSGIMTNIVNDFVETSDKRFVMNRLRLLTALLLLSACAACASKETSPIVIPRPASVQELPGHFTIREPLAFAIEAPDSVAGPLSAQLRGGAILCVEEAAGSGDVALRFRLDDAPELPASEEGYRLAVRPEGIEIGSRGAAGLFYGWQTLLQLHAYYDGRIPAREIVDEPRFAWRGLHLDVSRHFFDKEFVCKQLRMMSSLKLNRLHLHLTDGAGWRIEIDRFPLLTEVAAWRVGATWKEWWMGDRSYCRRDDPRAAGGYYTKEEIREIVACADSLHITVVPEIEFPGHSEEVLAVFPELGCPGRPDGCGELCLGNETSFRFLEKVLAEVLELFPSAYIHVGGDEASTAAWASCPKCRARMAREGLKTPEELQNWAMRRVGRFLEAQGRTMVGWDEILDGGDIPARTVVMSWRGEEGGRKAAAAGHDVVMTPGGYCYFDGYQDNPMTEPQAFSGYLPLWKVYGYDPAPADMPGREHVLGVQANLWTEYIPTPEQAEYMYYPRAFALAEVAWSPVEGRDYDEFRQRALWRTARAREAGYNAFDLAAEQGERPESREPAEHLAVGCPVAYGTPWHRSYPAGGAEALTDGLRGSWSYATRWQGFLGGAVEVTVDLGAVKPIREVTADFIQWYSAWIWLPARVEIAVSDDGADFRQLATVENDYPVEEHRPVYRSFGWTGENRARFVRYRALSNGRSGGWLFTDEIVVR